MHRNPAVTVAETARMHLLRLASEFGLTPAAEQRLAVAPGDDGDGLNPFPRTGDDLFVCDTIEFGISASADAGQSPRGGWNPDSGRHAPQAIPRVSCVC
ncbi:hypothetical protein MRGA327_09870 [Mycobacterium tuberculosis RGTB327]|nr:hypothetical protein MRGA327_09870 [Mycobacterium tuberculosis RGTB327]